MGLLIPWCWAGSAICGAIGWSGPWRLLPFALGMVIAWRLSRTRGEAFGTAFCYYAVASFPMVDSVAVFFEQASSRWGLGVFLWLGGNALLSLVWAACWTRSVRTDVSCRLFRGTLCTALLFLPPLGLIGWANPWMAIGVILPGTGFLGLGLIHLVVLGSTKKTFGVFLTALLVATAVACGTYEGRVAGASFVGVSTSFGEIALSDTDRQFDVAFEIAELLKEHPKRVVLLPETVGGVWTPSTALLWETALFRTRSTVLVGALRRSEGGVENGLFVLGEKGNWFWSQRVPVPVGMWAPWSEEHIQSHVFGRAVYALEGHRATLLMCFEQLVAWPAIQSAMGDAEVVVAPANLWFARGTRVNAIRATSLRAWAQLFGWALVEAVNQ